MGKRILIALWRLATNIECRTLALLFAVGKSTVCQISADFTRSIVDNLMPLYVRFPRGELFHAVIDGFRERGFPQCGGAIDGTHVPIIAPPQHHTDYYNRKGWHSMIVQAVVDHEYKFMDIMAGWPGSVHDARVFQNSRIYKMGMDSTLFPDWLENIHGVEVPVALIGDPAYPLYSWMMKAYPRGNLSADQERFNYRLSSARMVVENAFGRLKGRWRCLLKRYDGTTENLVYVIGACCTLHNICEQHREEFPQQWLDEVHRVDANWEQPRPQTMNINAGNRTSAQDIREAITQWLRVN